VGVLLALAADGSIISWGSDISGVVTNIPAGSGYQAIAAGATNGTAHSLAIASDGSIVSWGDDSLGQVSNTPGGTGWAAIAAGNKYSMALSIDGSITGWGQGLVVGTGTTGVDWPVGNNFVAIAGGPATLWLCKSFLFLPRPGSLVPH